MNRDSQQSDRTDDTDDTDDDVNSDPALDDGGNSDWSSEGGATPTGPATDPEAGTP